MRKILALAVIIVWASIPASAQKVYVDYSPLADFGNYTTFAWGETPQASLLDNNPLNHSRIKHTVDYYLIQGGMVEDTENPDLYLTYYGETDTEFNVNVSTAGYGYATDWAWDPYWGNASGMTTTTPTVHKAGTLVIDIWDAKTQKLIWRGSMEGTLTDNLQKSAKQIENGIAKIVKKWKKMRAKELKQ
jgi:hypothetical protein